MSSFNMDEALESRWMQRHHVPEAGVDLTIKTVTRETVGDMDELKFALHLHGNYKPLLLNKTNIRVLTSLYGPKSDGWIHQMVNVYDDPMVSYGGKLVGGVRLRAPVGVHQGRGQSAPTAGTLTPAQLGAAAKAYLEALNGTTKMPDDLDDTIPW